MLQEACSFQPFTTSDLIQGSDSHPPLSLHVFLEFTTFPPPTPLFSCHLAWSWSKEFERSSYEIHSENPFLRQYFSCCFNFDDNNMDANNDVELPYAGLPKAVSTYHRFFVVLCKTSLSHDRDHFGLKRTSDDQKCKTQVLDYYFLLIT